MDIDLLSKMVKDLILDNDEVSLPGVGTFVAELVPSTFSDKGYTINPPYRRLYFRQRKDTTDTALVELYAKSNDLDTERAGQIIEDFLSEMKDVLKQKKTIIFPGLGKLRATKENNIFFVADEDLDIYPAGFGLNPISLKTHVETSEEVAAAVASLKELVVPSPVASSQEPVQKAEEPAVEETAATVSESKQDYETPEVNTFSSVTTPTEPVPMPDGSEDEIISKEIQQQAEEVSVPEETVEEPLADETVIVEAEALAEELPIAEESVPEPVIDPVPSEEIAPEKTDAEEIIQLSEAVEEEPGNIDIEQAEPKYEEPSVSILDAGTAVESLPSIANDEEKEEVTEEKAAEESITETPAPVIAKESAEEEPVVPAVPDNVEAKANAGKVAALLKEKKAVVTTPSVLNQPEKKPGLPTWVKVLLWTLGTLIALIILYMIVARIAPNFIDSILYSKEDFEFLHEGKL